MFAGIGHQESRRLAERQFLIREPEIAAVRIIIAPAVPHQPCAVKLGRVSGSEILPGIIVVPAHQQHCVVSICGAVAVLIIGDGLAVVVEGTLGIKCRTDCAALHDPLLDGRRGTAVDLQQDIGTLHPVIGIIPLILGIALFPLGHGRILFQLCADACCQRIAGNGGISAADTLLRHDDIVAAGGITGQQMVGERIPAQRCLGKVQFPVAVKPAVRDLQSLVHNIGFTGTQRRICPAKSGIALVFYRSDIGDAVHIQQRIGRRQRRCALEIIQRRILLCGIRQRLRHFL